MCARYLYLSPRFYVGKASKRLALALISCLLSFIAFTPLHAREVSLDDLASPFLVPRDPIAERSWGKDSHLQERTDTIRGFELRLREPLTGRVEVEVSALEVAKALRQLPGFAEVKPRSLNSFILSPHEGELLFYIANNYFIYSAVEGKARRLTHSPGSKVGASFSPDGKMVAYIDNFNIWIVDLDGAISRQVTFDGNANLLYGRLDWVYQEEVFGRGNFKGYWWSPDSQQLAFLRSDEAAVGKYPLVDHLKTYGDLTTINYPKAGTANPLVTIGLLPSRGGDIVWLDLSPYELSPYLVVGLDFTPDSKHVVAQFQNRVQSFLDLRLYPLQGGEGHLLLREESKDWVSRLQEVPYWQGSNCFFWLSERSGYAHLYAYELNTDQQVTAVRALTSGPWEVRKLLHVQDEHLYLSTSKASLRENHLYHLNAHNGELALLTTPGAHFDGSFSPDGRYVLMTEETVSRPASKTLKQTLAGGRLGHVRDLFIPSLLGLKSLDLQEPEFLEVAARDGYNLQAMMIKPKGFDPTKAYPVLSYNYSGPASPVVRNEFSSQRYLWHQYLAQEGYLIWILDNRSASGNGHINTATIYQKLGVGELADLEDGIRFLKSKPWVDSGRIGLWGWSFGGYETIFALTHSEAFKAGIAVAPVVDWRLYDSIYTERYMNTPQANPEGYRCSSLLGCGEALADKQLMLIHGTMDENVHDQHTLQFVRELQQSGIDFDLMLYPNGDHGLNPQVHGHLYKKMTKFVLQNI